jgi:hypothetical protein
MSAAVAEAPAPVRQRVTAARRAPLGLWIALGVVLAVAAFTRLWHLDLIDFKADEAQIAGLAVDVAEAKWPATSIQTSGGIFNPPLPVYFLGLAALFTRDPAWQAAIIGLLDVVGVLAVFLGGRSAFCGRVGLAAAAFYAANAYATIFARKLAGPFLQPLFAALLLACLLEAGTRQHPRSTFRSGWPWAAAVFLLAILVQLHLGALLLAPVIAVLFALSRPRWPAWIGAAAGVAAGGTLFAPYLAYEFQHQPANFLPSLLAAAGGRPGWGFGAFQLLWVTITSPGYGDLAGSASSLFNAESWPAGFITPLAGVAVLGGLGVAFWRWRDRRYLTLAIFVLLPLLLTVRHTSDVRIHYFVFLEPATFLLAGIGFDALLVRWQQLRIPVFALLGLLLLVQTANLAHFMAFIRQHALPADGYGVPLAYQERLFDEALHMAAGKRVIVAVDGRDQADPAAYFLRGSPHAEVDADRGLLLPAAGGLYVTYGQNTQALSALEPAYTELFPGGIPAAAYHLDGQALSRVEGALHISQSSAPRWQNGVALTGTAAARALPGELIAEWRIDHAVEPTTIFFSQLIDDSGKQWFDDDAVPVAATAWQPGDTLLTYTHARLPADAPLQRYWWTVGMYQEGGRRVPLANGDSQLAVAPLKGGMDQPTRASFRPVQGTFGSALQLTGYALDPAGVTLRWSTLRAVASDYTVFVHAVNSSGTLLAQADGQPMNGHYPTSLWDPGETIIDQHALQIPPGAHLEVGLYDLATGQRLTLPDGSDQLTLPVT